MKNNYMEGPGSATRKKHSPSNTQRGRRNPFEQTLHNLKKLIAEKLALCSQTNVLDSPKLEVCAFAVFIFFSAVITTRMLLARYDSN